MNSGERGGALPRTTQPREAHREIERGSSFSGAAAPTLCLRRHRVSDDPFKGNVMAAAVAALAARARREIQHHFFAADAVRAERAVAFTPSGAVEARQFKRMLEAGSIKREGADRYWLDVVAYDVEVQQRHRRLRFGLLVIIGVLTIALVALASISGHAITR